MSPIQPKQHRRLRRSVQSQEGGGDQLSVDTPIFIKMNMSDRQFHVKLVPNHALLAPVFKVYTRKHVMDNTGRVSIETQTHDPDHHCYYVGHLVGAQHNSRVALSLCDGVVCICLN